MSNLYDSFHVLPIDSIQDHYIAGAYGVSTSARLSAQAAGRSALLQAVAARRESRRQRRAARALRQTVARPA